MSGPNDDKGSMPTSPADRDWDDAAAAEQENLGDEE